MFSIESLYNFIWWLLETFTNLFVEELFGWWMLYESITINLFWFKCYEHLFLEAISTFAIITLALWVESSLVNYKNFLLKYKSATKSSNNTNKYIYNFRVFTRFISNNK